LLILALVGQYALAQGVNAPDQAVMENCLETTLNYEIKDGRVILDFSLTNRYNRTKTLEFGSGQQFELVITDEQGEEVYRYSEGKFFTLALLYKDLQPGQSLEWQDTWDLTGKDGKPVTSGKYRAEATILAAIKDQEEPIEPSQLTVAIDIDLSAIGNEIQLPNGQAGIMQPAFAKELIKETAAGVIDALSRKDAQALAEFVHPVKGLRFTPYTTVFPERDLVFNVRQVRDFFQDQRQYKWGYYDGTGEEILLTPREYYDKFVYAADYANAEKIGYNQVLSFGNMLENQFDVYENAIVVEYYFSGFNPAYDGLDWRSLRLVFQEYEGSWKLVGLINNQWTI